MYDVVGIVPTQLGLKVAIIVNVQLYSGVKVNIFVQKTGFGI